jgi:hypothetical protein
MIGGVVGTISGISGHDDIAYRSAILWGALGGAAGVGLGALFC